MNGKIKNDRKYNLKFKGISFMTRSQNKAGLKGDSEGQICINIKF
jgi:hypothetical protein